MGAGDKYRELARKLLAQAQAAKDEKSRVSYERQAAQLIRQAAEADRNSDLTIEVELPPEEEGKTRH
jgi:hypothetical protein